jgi:acetyl esterase/lipase
MKMTQSERAAVDHAYDNSAHFPDVPEWRERWKQRNGERAPGPGERLGVAYGAGSARTLDLLPTAGAGTAPTAIFFHGGAWVRNSKETFRFLARGFHAAGLNVAFAGYSLAPAARMAQIVADATAATRWLQGNLTTLGLASLPLLVVGWSSGAQLAALQMSLDGVGGGLGISGVYDLAPLRHGLMNEALRLDESDVEHFSPARQFPSHSAPFTVAYGVRELPAYHEQSKNFHQALIDASLPTQLIELQGHHHHSVLDELFESNGTLVAHLSAMAQRLSPTRIEGSD